MPQTAAKVILQSTLIKNQVTKHQESSSSLILVSVDQLTKAIVSVSY